MCSIQINVCNTWVKRWIQYHTLNNSRRLQRPFRSFSFGHTEISRCMLVCTEEARFRFSVVSILALKQFCDKAHRMYYHPFDTLFGSNLLFCCSPRLVPETSPSPQTPCLALATGNLPEQMTVRGLWKSVMNSHEFPPVTLAPMLCNLPRTQRGLN